MLPSIQTDAPYSDYAPPPNGTGGVNPPRVASPSIPVPPAQGGSIQPASPSISVAPSNSSLVPTGAGPSSVGGSLSLNLSSLLQNKAFLIIVAIAVVWLVFRKG